jgi:hypothetical protein
MAKVSEFYSVYEGYKPATERVYHNNSACPYGCEILEKERRDGTDGYLLCRRCADLNNSLPENSKT